MVDSSKLLAEAIKKGGKILSETCPFCKVPLVRFKDVTKCVVCQRQFILVKDEEEVAKAKVEITLLKLREDMRMRLDKMISRMDLSSEFLTRIKLILEILSKIEELLVVVRSKGE